MKLVENGDFREDLYYRLNVFPLRTLALKDRPDDILPISGALIQKHIGKDQSLPLLTSKAIDVLKSHTWPGNVRELENCMERAVILCNEDALQHIHLPPSLQRVESKVICSLDEMIGLKEKVKEFENQFAEYFNSKYALMVNSGSTANLLMVASLILSKNHDLNRGDEVIVPSVSWSTTYYPLSQYVSDLSRSSRSDRAPTICYGILSGFRRRGASDRASRQFQCAPFSGDWHRRKLA